VTEPVLAALQQWLLFTGVTLVVGCVTWWWAVLPGALRALGEADGALAPVERRVASLGLVTALGLVAVWALKMVVQVLGFHFPGDPLWPDVSFLLFETFWGTVWMAQGAVVPLLAVAFALARGGRPAAWRTATLLALALVASLALSSHAVGVDAWRSLIVTGDGVHALAAGTWIGSLGVILLAGRPATSDADPRGFAAQIRAFSPMAVASVTALLVMGVVLAWSHLTALSDLWQTTYGRVLSAKIFVAGLVLLAGLWNWRVGIPRIDTVEGAGSVRNRAIWEVLFAVGVLLITAILVHSPKP